MNFTQEQHDRIISSMENVPRVFGTFPGSGAMENMVGGIARAFSGQDKYLVCSDQAAWVASEITLTTDMDARVKTGDRPNGGSHAWVEIKDPVTNEWYPADPWDRQNNTFPADPNPKDVYTEGQNPSPPIYDEHIARSELNQIYERIQGDDYPTHHNEAFKDKNIEEFRREMLRVNPYSQTPEGLDNIIQNANLSTDIILTDANPQDIALSTGGGQAKESGASRSA